MGLGKKSNTPNSYPLTASFVRAEWMMKKCSLSLFSIKLKPTSLVKLGSIMMTSTVFSLRCLLAFLRLLKD
jgi:hypothetical protein